MSKRCRSYQGAVGRTNKHMSSRWRRRWWRMNRRKVRQMIVAAMPRFDLDLLP